MLNIIFFDTSDTEGDNEFVVDSSDDMIADEEGYCDTNFEQGVHVHCFCMFFLFHNDKIHVWYTACH